MSEDVTKYQSSKSFREFLKKIIRSDSRESSKRLLAILAFCLVASIVIAYTNSKNLEYVVTALLSFILALLGISTWENIKSSKKSNEPDQQSEK